MYMVGFTDLEEYLDDLARYSGGPLHNGPCVVRVTMREWFGLGKPAPRSLHVVSSCLIDDCLYRFSREVPLSTPPSQADMEAQAAANAIIDRIKRRCRELEIEVRGGEIHTLR